MDLRRGGGQQPPRRHPARLPNPTRHPSPAGTGRRWSCSTSPRPEPGHDPRGSRPTEVRGSAELPAYRGDAVNGFEFTQEARTPDPGRLLRAYHCSAVTLNLCRAFTTGGYADLHQAHGWNQDFVRESPSGQHYERLADAIDLALAFMRAFGANPAEVRSAGLYTVPEDLLLYY